VSTAYAETSYTASVDINRSSHGTDELKIHFNIKKVIFHYSMTDVDIFAYLELYHRRIMRTDPTSASTDNTIPYNTYCFEYKMHPVLNMGFRKNYKSKRETMFKTCFLYSK
jgi:hypothetical protein